MADTRICPRCGYGMDDFDDVCDDCKISMEDEANEDFGLNEDGSHCRDYVQDQVPCGSPCHCVENGLIKLKPDAAGGA